MRNSRKSGQILRSKKRPRRTLRSGRGSRTNSNTSRQIPARVIEPSDQLFPPLRNLNQFFELITGERSRDELQVDGFGRNHASARKVAAHPPHQSWRKLLRILDRLGCFSFLSALASIWRMRSRVTENRWPTSSRVWSLLMPIPKRMRSTRSSRGVSKASVRVVVSRRFDWIAASIGRIAFLSSMKSPRWESSSSPIGVSSDNGSLAILSANLLERHAELPGKLLGRRLAADLVEHLARLTHDFADAVHHMDGDADRARLVGDRARDRLPDPPGGIGRKLVAAAILELIDRLHQADIAFLDQVEELEAAVGVFLGDRDDEAQVRLHHLFLGLARLALALLHHLHDLAELADLEPGLAGEYLDLVAVPLDLVLVASNEALPALGGELRNAVEPARIELRALVVLEKILARDAVALGEPHQAALVADEALVDVVELLDQRVDARLIEPQRLYLDDDVVLELLVAALLRGRERVVAQLVLDVLVLQAAQPLVGVGDVVEGLHHLGLELGLDGCKRERVLHIVVVEVAFAGRG